MTHQEDSHILSEWIQALQQQEEKKEENREYFIVAVREGMHVAFPLHDARYVARLTTFSPLPGAHDLLPGVTNLEGRVLPLLDLGPLLDLPPLTPTTGLYVIVIAREGIEAGILVHKAVDIHEVPADHIQTEETASAYIRGIYNWPLEEKTFLVQVINTERLFEAARSVYG